MPLDQYKLGGVRYVRYWIHYDGGTTQETDIRKIARMHGGRLVATTDAGDDGLLAVVVIPKANEGDFLVDLDQAGYEEYDSEEYDFRG